MALATVLDIRALALAPIAVTYLGYMYYRDDDSLKKFGKNRAVMVFGLIGAFVAVYVLTLPVAVGHLGENAFYGMRMIANQMINNQIFVDNAFGFYGMATLNGQGFNNTASILNLVFISGAGGVHLLAVLQEAQPSGSAAARVLHPRDGGGVHPESDLHLSLHDHRARLACTRWSRATSECSA